MATAIDSQLQDPGKYATTESGAFINLPLFKEMLDFGVGLLFFNFIGSIIYTLFLLIRDTFFSEHFAQHELTKSLPTVALVLAICIIACIQLIFFHSWYVTGGLKHHYKVCGKYTNRYFKKLDFQVYDIIILVSAILLLIFFLLAVFFYRFDYIHFDSYNTPFAGNQSPSLPLSIGILWLTISYIIIFAAGILGNGKIFPDKPAFLG